MNLPSMNEEQRKKLVKVVAQISEDIKIEVRNVRRDYIEKIKKAQKTSCSIGYRITTHTITANRPNMLTISRL